MNVSTVTPAPKSVSDLAYILITRAKGKCAICSKKGADSVFPLVPESYGGNPEHEDNLQPAHERCARLRHKIEGNSAEPSDPKSLRRLMALLPDLTQGVLRRAARAGYVRSYDSVDAVTLLDRAIEANIGFALRGHPCPEGITSEDWTWLQSSEAFSALHDAAWALLKSEY